MSKPPKQWHQATTKMIIDILLILAVFVAVIFLLSSRANSNYPSAQPQKVSPIEKKPIIIRQPKALT